MIHRLRSKGEVVAQVPGLLGFVPAKGDLALMAFGRCDELVVAVRMGSGMEPGEWLHLRDVIVAHGAVSVLVIGVGARSYGEARAFAETVEHDGHVEVRGVVIVEDMCEGACWMDVRNRDLGYLPDPMVSRAATEWVGRGNVVAASRDELGARWAHRAAETVEPVPGPLPVGVIAERVAVLERIGADEGVYPGHPRRPITAEDAAEFGALVAYGGCAMRDAALVIPNRSADFTRLSAVWGCVASFLTAQTRLEALVVAAAYSYMAGEGATAGVGLATIASEVEAGAGEEPSLVKSLNQALTVGAAPEEVLAIIRAGAEESRARLLIAAPGQGRG